MDLVVWCFFVLSTRPSYFRIKRESRGLHILRLLTVGLSYDTCVWVSRLRENSKYGVQMGATCEPHILVVKCGSHVLSLTFEFQHLDVISLFSEYWYCVLLFAVRYVSNPLTKKNHFGLVSGVDPNLLFSLRKTIPAFTSTNEECQSHLSKGDVSMLQEHIADGRFDFNDRCHFRKPVFLFGDAIDEDEEIMFDGNYKWLHQIGE